MDTHNLQWLRVTLLHKYPDVVISSNQDNHTWKSLIFTLACSNFDKVKVVKPFNYLNLGNSTSYIQSLFTVCISGLRMCRAPELYGLVKLMQISSLEEAELERGMD